MENKRMIEPHTPSMDRVEGMVGHEPNDFTPACRYHPDDVAKLRYSRIIVRQETMEAVNRLGYKCRRCGKIERFDVVTDEEYAMEIIKRRSGSTFYVPDASEWCSEDAEVQARFKALGYM